MLKLDLVGVDLVWLLGAHSPEAHGVLSRVLLSEATANRVLNGALTKALSAAETLGLCALSESAEARSFLLEHL